MSTTYSKETTGCLVTGIYYTKNAVLTNFNVTDKSNINKVIEQHLERKMSERGLQLDGC